MGNASNTIVDLFSGCGGLGLGAELAGWDVKVAVDCDATLQSAYRFNFPDTDCVIAELEKVGKEFWQKKLNGAKVAGVIGGPPCQGFSSIGQRRVGDPRNLLVGHFFRHVRLIKPKFFVMENVVGLLEKNNLAILQDALDSLKNSYQIVGPLVLNAADFGAATNRKRAFVFGYDRSEVDALDIGRFKELFGVKKRNSVRDAIADLPTPSIGVRDEQYGFYWHPSSRQKSVQGLSEEQWRGGGELSPYAMRARRYPKQRKFGKKIGWSFACAQQRAGLVSGLLPTEHTAEVKARFAATACGETEAISRFARLSWDGLCPVLRAGTGRERGGHQAARPIHPQQARVISVREAARLQSFPDWFVFHPTRWHSFRMIGNSVSPIISKALHIFLKKMVDG